MTAADWNVTECGDINMDQEGRVRVLDTVQRTARDTIDARLWVAPHRTSTRHPVEVAYRVACDLHRA